MKSNPSIGDKVSIPSLKEKGIVERIDGAYIYVRVKGNPYPFECYACELVRDDGKEAKEITKEEIKNLVEDYFSKLDKKLI